MLEDNAELRKWAEQEFGQARLHDQRRTERLIRMASQAAAHPAGQISAVFTTDSEREAAYDWLENEAISPSAVAQACYRATAVRCLGQPLVFAPVDKASLTLTDPQRLKDLGPVGTRAKKGRGLQVMTGIAVDQEGTPQGLIGQAYWSRSDKPNPVNRNRRAVEEKETRYWGQVMKQGRGVFAEQAPG